MNNRRNPTLKPVTKLIKPLLAAITLAAASSGQAGTLADIYNLALTNDPQLKASEAALRAGQEALPQAKAGLLPSINLSANTTYNNTDTRDYNNNGFTLALTQPVFSAARWFNFQLGETLSDQAVLTYDIAQQDLILRSVESYLTVLRALNALETSQAEERAIKRRLDQVNAQFEVGLIAITDVQEAEAQFDNARVNRIEAEGDLYNSYEALERLSGQTFDEVDLLKAEYPVENLSPMESKPWLEKAWQGNLPLQQARLQVEAARKSAKIANAGHYPTLDLNASYDYDDGNINANTDNETTSIGLTFSLPIYQGGATQSQSRQAYAELDQAQQLEEDNLRSVTQQTRSLLRDLRTSVLSVNARAQSIKSSETALKATEEGFNVGTRNVVDVLDAERALYAAQRDYANARFDYVQTLFSLKQQLGTLNPDDLMSLDSWLAPAEN